MKREISYVGMANNFVPRFFFSRRTNNFFQYFESSWWSAILESKHMSPQIMKQTTISIYVKYDTLYYTNEHLSFITPSLRTRLCSVVDRNTNCKLLLSFNFPICGFIFLFTISFSRMCVHPSSSTPFGSSNEEEVSPRAPFSWPSELRSREMFH